MKRLLKTKVITIKSYLIIDEKLITCVEDFCPDTSCKLHTIDLYLAISGCYEHRRIICNVEQVRNYNYGNVHEIYIYCKYDPSLCKQKVNTLTHLDIDYNTNCDVYYHWTEAAPTHVKFAVHVINDRG